MVTEMKCNQWTFEEDICNGNRKINRKGDYQITVAFIKTVINICNVPVCKDLQQAHRYNRLVL